jgi:glycerol-3-phosphate dehydrogenase
MNHRLNELKDQHYDVLVIGGGIVGAGVARDAGLRGLQTLLVEQSDFASGTSSRSSRLLHGGLRYLAQGHVGLVREASREKMVLHRVAPHLSQPLPFLFPTYRGSGLPRWKLWLGTKTYDLLCGRMNLGNSRALSPDQVQQQLPGVLATGLTGAVRYFDALTNDARLVIDTLRSAERHGAILRNYVQLTSADPVHQGWQCQLNDQLSSQSVQVTARAVVNATGPWSDQLPHSQTSLRLTKGVHLVIPSARLPVPDAVVMADGERILFAIPWGENVILGTTDTDYRGPLADPQCDETDMMSVLEVVNRVFPAANLQREDIQSTWAGVRPLVADKRGNPSDISRRHEIKQAETGWWDVTGGKLTTYRLMAEEVVDRLIGSLNVKALRCQTADERLLPENETKFSGILSPEPRVQAVEHFCEHEWVIHLDDVMLRRTSWRHSLPQHANVARQVAGWMATKLNWDETTLAKELDRYERMHQDPIRLAGSTND